MENDSSIAVDMILLGEDTAGTEAAQRGVRALCRYFGGQLIYVPRQDTGGECAKKILGVLTDAVGEEPASAILDKIMFRYGGTQVYIPFERNAFRKTIALEIYERHYTHGVPVPDLAREYGISFTLAYTLWREGQREKFERTLPYLPFSEFLQ
jgi:Mor family transcriptional regulator